MCKGDVGRLTFGGAGGASNSRWSRSRSAAVLARAARLAHRLPRALRGPALRPTASSARAPPPQPPVVLSRNGKDYTMTAINVRAGTEIKVTTERPTVNLAPDRTGYRLVGDLRAAGIHHRSLGYAAEQPRCAAQGQRHLVLQGQGCAVGQGGLQR